MSNYDTIDDVINDPRTQAFVFVALGPGKGSMSFSAQRNDEYQNNVRLTAAAIYEQLDDVNRHDIDKDRSDFIQDVIEEVKAINKYE